MPHPVQYDLRNCSLAGQGFKSGFIIDSLCQACFGTICRWCGCAAQSEWLGGDNRRFGKWQGIIGFDRSFASLDHRGELALRGVEQHLLFCSPGRRRAGIWSARSEEKRSFDCCRGRRTRRRRRLPPPEKNANSTMAKKTHLRVMTDPSPSIREAIPALLTGLLPLTANGSRSRFGRRVALQAHLFRAFHLAVDSLGLHRNGSSSYNLNQVEWSSGNCGLRLVLGIERLASAVMRESSQ